MVNEVVMYQSMFVLGIVMFGFFATSFNNYSNFAEQVTLDKNLDRLLQEISQELLDLLDSARTLRGNGGDITIDVKLSLDSEYATEAYTIYPVVDGNNVSLVAKVRNEIISSLNLPYEAGTQFNIDQIQFSGSLTSSSDDTRITYVYDSIISTQQIIFS